MRLPLALVAALLAGCSAPAGELVAAPGPVTLPWGLGGCSYVIVSVPVDEARLAARLPEGFRLAASTLTPLPLGPRGELSLDAYVCKTGVGHDGPLQGVQYGSHYAYVEPPAVLREEAYGAYFVKWDPLIHDPARLEALRAAGMRAHAGNASVTMARAPGGGWGVVASLSFQDGGGFTFVGATGPPQAQGEPLPFVEFTPLETGGLARWHARLHGATFATGTGTVELAEGSWTRDVVGSDRAAATFIAGAWNLDEADVTFPVRWP